MPLINGQKMACEPCIRGHRSTKCNHAKERLMVPVRKPGRPLSACPHAPSQVCGCAGVTAAIPRKQQCSCGTSKSMPALDENSARPDSPNSTSDSSASPARTANAAAHFRVQKAGSKSNGRKQSFDPATLERMDASHINVLPQLAHANGGIPPMGPVPNFAGTPPLLPGDMTFSPQLGFVAYPPPIMPPPINGKLSVDSNAIIAPSIPVTAPPTPVQSGSCCSAPPAATTASPKQSTPAQTGGSCCSGSSSTEPAAAPGPANMTLGDMAHVNAVPISPFQHVMGLGPAMFPTFYHQPMIYTYPPQYGSYLQPLQPAQWRQTMEAMNFAAFSMPGPVNYMPPGSQQADAGTSHQCDCGDECQCIGCAAHPYNEATQNYVRSAWNTMAEDSTKPASASQEAEAPEQGTSAEPKANEAGPGSPPAPQTPSDAASGISEEQALSASDFFFVTYPLSGDPTCLGSAPTCPCGDDCECIGCSIHNTGESAEASA